ncbi:MAG: ComEC/Rec2 family competence protein [Candidatus Omnitrophota bacterium]
MLKKIFSAALLNFWLFITFACGIILAYYFSYFLAFSLLFVISIILILFFYKQQKFLVSDIFIALLFFSLGGLMFLPYASSDVDKFSGKDNNYVLKVSSLPQGYSLRNNFFSEINKVNNIPVVCRVKVIDYTKKMNYLATYKVTGRLSKRQFGNFNFYSLWVKSNVSPEEVPMGMWDNIAKRLTFRLLDIFKKNLSDESYRFLASVFLGRRELLDKEEKGIFTDAGIAHLLAISGSNVGITAVVLFFILKLFNIRFKAGLLVCILFLFIYTFITGASPPIMRATIMYTVFVLSFFVKRKLNPFNSLGLAGLVCLLINPSWLFDVGFQLSFLSIFALILGFKIFPITSSKIEIVNQLKYLFFSSLYVTVLITPLVAYYFGRVYILSIFNNIILIPFFSLILTINFILLVFSPFKLIAQSIGSVLSALIPVFYNLSKFLGAIIFSFFSCYFSVQAIFIYYFVLAAALIFLGNKKIKAKVEAEE